MSITVLTTYSPIGYHLAIGYYLYRYIYIMLQIRRPIGRCTVQSGPEKNCRNFNALSFFNSLR